MKTKSITILSISFILATAAIVATFPNAQPSTPDQPRVTRMSRTPEIQQPATDVEPTSQITSSEAELSSQPAETIDENLAHWSQRFSELLAASGDREAAMDLLRAEVDGVFSQWVADSIAPLVALPAGERYDSLEIISQTVREGAAAVLERLEIPGRWHDSLTPNAMDMVRAEIEYAEAAPDSASRLAMLKLDRERQARLQALAEISDEAKLTEAMNEIEMWYATNMAAVFPADEVGDGLE